MLRVTLIIWMVASVAAADSSTPGPAKSEKCLDSAAEQAAMNRLASEEKRLLEEALHGAGAQRVELQSDLFRDDGAMPVGIPKPIVLPAWRVSTDDKGRKVVAEEPWVEDCGPDRTPPLPLFARAADGTLKRVVVEKWAGRKDAVLLCGCPPEAMNRCGVAMHWTMQRRWILPAGESYSGELRIHVKVRSLEKRYTKSGFQQCPPSPQPP